MTRQEERDLQALFATVAAPSTLDRWRESAVTGGPNLPTRQPIPERWLREDRHRLFAVAAAYLAAVAVAVTGGLASGGEPPAMDIAAPPAQSTLAGYPSAADTGVSAGTPLDTHHGDLRVSTPGTQVTNLWVTGALIIDAPGVRLSGVRVTGGVRQHARDLVVVDSELGAGLTQDAPELTLVGSDVTGPVLVRAGHVVVLDNYFARGGVVVAARDVVVRHNTLASVVVTSAGDVTVEHNLVGTIRAPAGVLVRDNRFTR
jgi:hypothetical protein